MIESLCNYDSSFAASMLVQSDLQVKVLQKEDEHLVIEVLCGHSLSVFLSQNHFEFKSKFPWQR